MINKLCKEKVIRLIILSVVFTSLANAKSLEPRDTFLNQDFPGISVLLNDMEITNSADRTKYLNASSVEMFKNNTPEGTYYSCLFKFTVMSIRNQFNEIIIYSTFQNGKLTTRYEHSCKKLMQRYGAKSFRVIERTHEFNPFELSTQ